MRIQILTILLCFSTIKLYAQDLKIKILSEDDLKNFVIIDAHIQHSGSDAYIAKVSDGTNLYILKQIHDSSIYEQFLLVNDVIASNIGYQAGININEVSFIPYNIGANLKFYTDRAATLHSYIPGKDLEQNILYNFSLQQRSKPQWDNKFLLPDNEQGITKLVLESMCLHDNLINITALDTFVGNADRSLPNIFYDDINNQLYGIDQAAAFTKKLPMHAYNRFKELILENYFDTCPVSIILSLRLYRNMLVYLQENYGPLLTIEYMQKTAFYLAPDALQNNEIKQRLRYQAKIINNNYDDCKQLILLLNQIL